MRGEPADGTADGIVTRGPSCRPVPSLDQDVVTGPAVEDVLPRPADQHVVAGAADQGVVPRAADQFVVAVTAVHRELDRVGRQAGSSHHVITGQGFDGDLIIGGLGTGDVHLGGQALDGNAALVAADHDHVVAAGAVDDDGVRGAVAGAAPGGRRQVDVDLGHV